MQTNELREKYLAFYASKGHTRCASDVLVPRWDPSVLFTPAGMNPFKDHFLGRVKLTFTRATSCQKCLRTGDIENVGRTAYHHTFFEMLGNFSFGDYFKREAIHWAWEFLTDKKWLGIEPGRLSVTVYLDDDEAAGIWQKEIGLGSERIERMGEADNFWPASAPSQGPDGVCGPCSEIYYLPPGATKSVEIWNLVFTQFNRVGPPPNNLKPLPSKNIDTGMGLERTASVLQNVDTNFHIDILRPIVEAAGEVLGLKYDSAGDSGRRLRRITDHVRACTMAIHENVSPGPNKQAYVVRRLLRRAVLDGHQLGRKAPFLHLLVPKVVEMMAAPYPELRETVQRVAHTIRAEEQTFLGSLDAGMDRMLAIFSSMQSQGKLVVDGRAAAEMYQTFGVPPELFESLAAERNLAFDWQGFKSEMEEHGRRSGGGVVELFKSGPIEALKKALHRTEFVGYQGVECEAEIKGLAAQEHLLDTLTEIGHEKPVLVVLDRSPFYGESGGQVGDKGELTAQGMRFQVIDTQKDGELVLHYGHLLEGTLKPGQKVKARVDIRRRDGIRRAHSATHILHHALQTTLGKHAQQAGSKVDEDWLRFDFANPAPVSAEQLASIEEIVGKRVAAAAPIRWDIVPLAQARQAGAMMLFGEKYPDPVRMVSMGEFSRELCGGTHLENTSDVGSFEVVAEEAVSAGTRRVVALTGEKAREHIERTRGTLAEVARLLHVSESQAPAAVKSLAQTLRDLKKQLSGGGSPLAHQPREAAPGSESLPYPAAKAALREAARALNVAPFDAADRVRAQLAEVDQLRAQAEAQKATPALSAETLLAAGRKVGSTLVVAAETPGANPNLMRQLIDSLRKQASSAAILLAAKAGDDKVTLIAALTPDLVQRGLSAGNWVKETAAVVGGSGGGKPDLAQAGGKLPEKLPEALQTANTVIDKFLGG